MKLEDFKKLLIKLNFKLEKDIYTKHFKEFDCTLKVDLKNQLLIYPENKGLVVNERQTCNFKANENFVVFECVHRLLNQGYNPKHIELEPKWQVGHGASGGRADILVKDNSDKSILIIECKTAGKEFNKAWQTTQTKPTQLFSYVQQARSTKFIALYASDFVDDDVQANYYLINLTDNEDLLKNNPKLKSYKDATEVEDIYRVWVNTYEKDYSTLGLFENNKPYEIGKTKFNIEDLKNITSNDIQGKYHEFATILRQHNVSGRENAFDKLVNLFLCKVTDETTNKDELKFYWKGKAYDDPFAFQDRLQQLYKKGMEKFLGETITYIDNKQIDEAFSLFKNKPNTTKDKIQSYFKQLKFFTNNDFAFIDVHNEKLFYQNFEVLLKIARMIQDISLTSSDENQFLGDMFEGFLDQGVKQSEGQFFTPTPIVKFIINSLPNIQNPNVIDYACGAGHFLNEYATTNKTANIVGIEKEYRLSKVAKVSSFMYGSDINIIYDDALSSNENIKENSFDVLIANPPYSVKGFLETISQDDRDKYELIKTIDEKSFQANNSIECFFIEKAKQLLRTDAVAGIIVPSSILNKGSQNIGANKSNVYVATREIILKYFDIVAITEFGSGTFGKTGTNTVTLFLKRRDTNIDIANHLKNMLDSWFECDFTTNENFKDSELLNEYCKHLNYDLQNYKTLLCESLDDKLFDYEMFKEYKIEFEKLTDTKNRRNTRTYKALATEQKEEIEKKELIKYIRAIEKEKLYYFCLAFKNQTDVIIVKAPNDNKESKKFLGYEWSSAKGNEGIKYLSSSSLKVDDENLDEDDKRVLENLRGLKNINTPLYNPQNSEDETKINKIIKDNFGSGASVRPKTGGVKTQLPKELETYLNRARLVDMLDFTRVEFNKAINLSVDKKIEIESKYPLVKLGDKFEISKGKIITQKETEEGNIKVVAGGMDFAYLHNEANRPKNIITVSASGANAGYINFWNEEIFASDCTTIYSKNIELLKFVFNVLKVNQNKLFDLARGSAQPHVYPKDIENFKIPLPPLEIQEKIVNECQKIDDEVEKANIQIENLKDEISNKINSINADMIKLEKVVLINSETFDPTTKPNGSFIYVDIDSIGKGDGFISYENIILGKEAPSRARRVVKNDSVVISTVRPYLKGFAYVENQTPNCIFSTGFAVLEGTENLSSKYLFLLFMFSNDLMKQMEEAMPKSSYPSINKKDIENFKIPLPNLETQKQIVLEIEKLEEQINRAKNIVSSAKEKKEEILKSYL